MLGSCLLFYKCLFEIFKWIYIFDVFSLTHCIAADAKEQIKIQFKENIKSIYLKNIFHIFRCESTMNDGSVCSRTINNYFDQSLSTIHFVAVNNKKILIYCDQCYKISQNNHKDGLLCTLKKLENGTKFLCNIFKFKKKVLKKISKIIRANLLDVDLLSTDSSEKSKLFQSTIFLIKNLFLRNFSGIDKMLYQNKFERLQSSCLKAFKKKNSDNLQVILDILYIKPKIKGRIGDRTCYMNAVLQMLSSVYVKNKFKTSSFDNVLNEEDDFLSTLFYTLEIMTLDNNGEIQIEDLIQYLIKNKVKFNCNDEETFYRQQNNDVKSLLEYIFSALMKSKNKDLENFMNLFITLREKNVIKFPHINSLAEGILLLKDENEDIDVGKTSSNHEYIIVENLNLDGFPHDNNLGAFFDTEYKFKGSDDIYKCKSALVFKDFIPEDHKYPGHYVYVDKYNIYDNQFIKDVKELNENNLLGNRLKQNLLFPFLLFEKVKKYSNNTKL